MTKFVIVRGDDWEGLYKDGLLITQGHEIVLSELADAAGIDLQEWSIYNFLAAYERSTLPGKLSDVEKDA